MMPGKNRFAGRAACVALILQLGANTAAVADATEGHSAKVDALFAEWDSTSKPGCSIAVSKDGAIVHERGYGMANLEHGVPNRPDSVFHIASVSKQFTAAAIAMLILEKKISSEDSIGQYLPELPTFDQVVTIGHVIHHSSGLRDFSDLMDLSGWRYYQDLVTNDDAMGVLARQKSLIFVPGSKYQYNNSNYLVMGEIVHRVTGQSLREFTAERIFKPLGMEHSYFRDNFADIVPNFAAGYDLADKGFTTSLTNFSAVGYSSLLTTVRDLMKWEENFYTGRVGGKAMVDLMQTPGKLNDGKVNKYAFGIVIDEHRGYRMIDHSGGDAGYATHLVRFPDQHLSVVVLCNINSAGPSELALRSAEIYLGLDPLPEKRAQAPAVAVKVSEKNLSSKAGRYLNAQTEEALTLSLRDGKLYSVAGDVIQELIPLSAQRFLVNGGRRWELTFDKASGIPKTLSMQSRYGEQQSLERIAEWIPTAAELQTYAGRYQSDEIDAPFRIQVVDGQLMLRSIKFKADLTPITQELFSAGWTNLRFDRDESGRISGFRYGEKDEPLATFKRASQSD